MTGYLIAEVGQVTRSPGPLKTQGKHSISGGGTGEI